MAKRTDPPALRSPRIDWSQYADGQWWELTQGRDFPQLPSQALKAVRNWGQRHGLETHGTATSATTIKIQIKPRPPARRPRTR